VLLLSLCLITAVSTTGPIRHGRVPLFQPGSKGSSPCGSCRHLRLEVKAASKQGIGAGDSPQQDAPQLLRRNGTKAAFRLIERKDNKISVTAKLAYKVF
jgi:hypothetical protein